MRVGIEIKSICEDPGTNYFTFEKPPWRAFHRQSIVMGAVWDPRWSQTLPSKSSKFIRCLCKNARETLTSSKRVVKAGNLIQKKGQPASHWVCRKKEGRPFLYDFWFRQSGMSTVSEGAGYTVRFPETRVGREFQLSVPVSNTDAHHHSRKSSLRST